MFAFDHHACKLLMDHWSINLWPFECISRVPESFTNQSTNSVIHCTWRGRKKKQSRDGWWDFHSQFNNNLKVSNHEVLCSLLLNEDWSIAELCSSRTWWRHSKFSFSVSLQWRLMSSWYKGVTNPHDWFYLI